MFINILRDKGSVGIQTVISAFWRLVRFHLGTAAFGSFIIALIQLVRIILAYIEHLVKKYEVRMKLEISEFYKFCNTKPTLNMIKASC